MVQDYVLKKKRAELERLNDDDDDDNGEALDDVAKAGNQRRRHCEEAVILYALELTCRRNNLRVYFNSTGPFPSE